MKAIVTTCNAYAHLVLGFQWLWKKYVGLDITIVHMPQEKTWCAALAEAVAGIEDEHILLVLEDYWMVRPMNKERFEKLLWVIQKWGIAKVDLQRQVFHWQHIPCGEYYEAAQLANYRASTQTAIWKKSHLLRKLECGGSAWDFELQSGSMNDGATILGLAEPTMDYANVMYKGKPDVVQIQRIQESDWKEMATLHLLPIDFLQIRPVLPE